jgi:hypothetical protein
MVFRLAKSPDATVSPWLPSQQVLVSVTEDMNIEQTF